MQSGKNTGAKPPGAQSTGGKTTGPARGSRTGRDPGGRAANGTAGAGGAGSGTGNNGLGRYGEEVAARWLAQDGLRILERNWRCAEGELDIVALDGDTLAVCEVKTRSERGFQQPTQAIDQTKADRLHRLAARWLDERWPVHFDRLVQVAEAARTGVGLPGVAGDGSTPAEAPPARTDRPTGTRKPRKGGSPPAPGDPPTAAPPAPPPPGGVRIDLVAVVNRLKGAAQVEHLRGAI
ncbi:YraN family protein [Kitasatospora sp. NPDC049258]|uniref:YraN family protein n=1 Tax=Kitasatospora sp. NPDC049258 TaxID=3155394 RepID=UPI003435CBDB